MLTSFRFRNLGDFQDQQNLHFHEVEKNGKGKGRLGILVGPNNTGKSSCLEFLRRCMSAEINHSNSKIYETKNPAWALAHFQIDKNTLYKYVGYTLMKNVFDDLNNINTDKLYMWTGVMFKNGYKIKVIQLDVDDGDGDKWQKAITGRTLVTERTRATHERSSGGSSVTFNRYDGPIVKDGEFMTNIQSDGETLTEEVFEEVYSSLFGINGLVTFVFDQRGIGAVTSTRCLELDEGAGQKNYHCTRERAKMITEMVKKVDKLQKQKDFDYLFAKLAATKDFTFKVEGDELKVCNKRSPNSPDETLKLPSGLLGSCLIALLLTLTDNYTTLVIDEPSLGMHPDMITRIREEFVDFVHRKNVTIVISTHAEQFVSQETLKNVFRFNRSASKGTLCCRYLPRKIFELKGYHIEEIRGWLFSSWLILVEGVTDAILIGAIVKKFSNMKGTDPQYLRLANAKIVGAGSSTKIPKLYSIFKTIGVKVCCVYDADANKERKTLGFWLTQNILDDGKLFRPVVDKELGYKIAENIRKLLNTTYYEEEGTEVEGANVNEISSFLCDAQKLYDLRLSLKDGQLMIYYLLEKTKRCKYKKREAFCEALTFASQQSKHLPLSREEDDRGDLKFVIGEKETKHETISFDDIRHLVVLESLFRPVWDSSKNEDTPLEGEEKYMMEAVTKTVENEDETRTMDKFLQGQGKTTQEEVPCPVAGSKASETEARLSVPDGNTTQPKGKPPQPGGNIPQTDTFCEDEGTFPDVDGKTLAEGISLHLGFDDKFLKPNGKTNQSEIKLHAEDKFYWGCGCIEDFVNVTLRNLLLSDTKLEPWTYRKYVVEAGKGQNGSPVKTKHEYLWYCQKKSPGIIEKLSFQEVNKLAGLILKHPDINPYMKDFEHFLLKNVERY